MPPTRGTRLGAYRVADAIGAGGMAEMYRARDTTLDRNVALKVPPVGDRSPTLPPPPPPANPP